MKILVSLRFCTAPQVSVAVSDTVIPPLVHTICTRSKIMASDNAAGLVLVITFVAMACNSPLVRRGAVLSVGWANVPEMKVCSISRAICSSARWDCQVSSSPTGSVPVTPAEVGTADPVAANWPVAAWRV